MTAQLPEPPGVPDPSADAGGSVFPGFSALSDDLGEVVTRLARHRRQAGLSQTEVAAHMGTSQSAVARLEAGRGDVRLSTLRRYAAALGHELQFGVRPEPQGDEPS